MTEPDHSFAAAAQGDLRSSKRNASGPFARRRRLSWRLRKSVLELGERTLVMGVVNVTPDSFSDGGRFLEPERAVEQALRLMQEGASVVDFGAESTRPGSHAGDVRQATVSAAEEMDRLLPPLEMLLRERPDVIVSIDTYKAETARAALRAGADIINDVSGFQWDSAMPQVCAEAQCGVVLMHTRGKPDEWLHQQPLIPASIGTLVWDGLAHSLQMAIQAGMAEEAVVLDPGYGFGKRMGENFALLLQQEKLLELERPLLVGLSRKSFLRWAMEARLGREVRSEASMEAASIAGLTAAVLSGASIVRVHSVRAAVEAVALADVLLDAAEPA